jgi:hypothetical protein
MNAKSENTGRAFMRDHSAAPGPRVDDESKRLWSDDLRGFTVSVLVELKAINRFSFAIGGSE